MTSTQKTLPFQLTSSAFAAEGIIPLRHSGRGEDLSPPLVWSAPPDGTKSLALVMDDADAVPVAGFVWDHWVLFNLPADTTNLPEGVPTIAELLDGSRQGCNSSGGLGYEGPCPPRHRTHRYVFTLYALDRVLGLNPGGTKTELLQAITGHILAQAQLAGRYTSP